jgi:hypothetical protein
VINVTFVPFLLVSSAAYSPDIVPFTRVYTRLLNNGKPDRKIRFPHVFHTERFAISSSINWPSILSFNFDFVRDAHLKAGVSGSAWTLTPRKT